MADGSLSQRLASIGDRIAAVCSRCGRSPSEITLVAVSKKHPVAQLEAAMAAGHTVFGESQVQEAERKASALRGVEWHLIGPLQSNKARRAARLFDVIHSIDRIKIADLVEDEASRLGRRVEVFLQVNLGDEETKHGFAADELERAAERIATMGHLRPVGLMAIPPWGPTAEDSRVWFSALRRLRDQAEGWPFWRERFQGGLSMGMSRDFEVAIEEGATHLRVGTGIFGRRPGT